MSPLVTWRSTGFACSGGGGVYVTTVLASMYWFTSSRIHAVIVLSPGARVIDTSATAVLWHSSSVQ